MLLDPPAAALEIQAAFMGAAAALVLLGAVLLRRRDAPAAHFAALILAFVVFGVSRAAEMLGWPTAASFTGVACAALGLLAPLSTAHLLGNATLIRRVRALLLPALVLGFLALWAPLAGEGGVRVVASGIIGGWAVLGVIGAAALAVRYTPDPSADWSQATRLRYLAVAQSIVALAVASDLVVWKLGGPRVGSLLAPLVYLYAGYLHLAQVRVSDLRQLIGNTVALSLTAVGLAGCYAAIRIWVGERLDLFLFNTFVASFALLLGFPTLRNRIRQQMDLYFMASKLELQRVLGALVERLVHIRTLDDLLKDLLGTLEQIERIRSSAIFLRDAPHLGFQQAGSIGLSPRARVNLIRHPAWVGALEVEDALIHEELEKARDEARDPQERERLDALCLTMRGLDAQLVLGLRSERGLVGFWTLSDAGPHEHFSTSEVRFLRSVADRIAVSVENSQTFERIRAHDRLASLGEMAAGLAHEIRNPIATIRGALEVLADPSVEGHEDFGQVVLEEIDRLDRVVGMFLDYARPHTRREPLHDVEGFVRGCVAAVARQRRGDGVALEISIAEKIPQLTVDADQLERVIINVLLNAYEALGGKGRIQVGARTVNAVHEDPQLEIVVADDGPGMDEATLDRAFVPFFTTKAAGIGLGLALCEKLVRSQGGSIQLRSRPGEGTSVRILLPCHGPLPTADSAQEVAES